MMTLPLLLCYCCCYISTPPQLSLIPRPRTEADATTTFPTLDISPLLTPGTSWMCDDDVSDVVDALRNKISETMEKWGGFYAIGHGLEKREMINNLRKEARSLFSMKTEEKQKLQITACNPLGWSSNETTKGHYDWKEIYDVGEDDLLENSRCASECEIYEMGGTYNQWPECQMSFRDAVTEYFNAATVVSQVLIDSLGCSLGEAGKTFIRESFKNHTSFMRLNFYPKCPCSNSKLGVNRHTDAGGLTIILMDEDIVSLQANRISERGEDNWVDVHPLVGRNAVLVLVGDMMQVISNHCFIAVEHRVKAQPHCERYSMVYFLNPAFSTEIKPIQDGERFSPKYIPFTWGDFRRQRILGDVGVECRFGKEDIQVHHFLKKEECEK